MLGDLTMREKSNILIFTYLSPPYLPLCFVSSTYLDCVHIDTMMNGCT